MNIEFTEKDITNALFYNLHPLVKSYPFSHYKNFTLRNIQIVFKLATQSRSQTVDNALTNVIYVDSDYDVRGVLRKIHPWMLLEILKAYKHYERQWSIFYFDNIEKYCEENMESHHNWIIAKHAGMSSVLDVSSLSIEQKFWININSNREYKKDRVFYVELRDSLLPWINPTLYQKMKEKDENTRTNVMYEQHRQQMYSGTFEGEDDLDIVK